MMRTVRRGPAARVARPAGSAAAGFSLVELLVVISIIALLVAIVMPSLGRARLIARKVTCQTRLKQIGRAGKSYYLEHNGWGVKIRPTSTTCFTDALQKYLDSEELLWCPSAFKTVNKARNGRRLDYGMNHYGYGYPKGSAEAAKYYGSFNGIQIHRVGYEDVIYFAEAETDSSPEDIGGASRGLMDWPIRVSFDRYAHDRHLDGYNWYMLNDSAGWFPAEPPTNEKWFIRKEQ